MADFKNSKKFKGGIRLDASTDTAPTIVEGEEAAAVGSMYVDTNGTLKIYNGSAWDSVGSGAGTTNYISTADSKVDTIANFNLYKDADQATPVDGTAGTSITVTKAQLDTGLLRGVNSLTFSAPGLASVRGQGISYDFTIDKADNAKKLIVSFDYQTGSNYADGDIAVFIYDVTNSNLIRLNGEDIKATLLPNQFIGQFQTHASSTSYRLIFHVVSVNATAYSLNLDNLSVAPQTLTQGAMVTDWKDFTGMTYDNFTLGNGSHYWKYRRVGDELELQGFISFGSTTTMDHASNAFKLMIPSGYPIDEDKLATVGSSDRLFGFAQVWDNSAGQHLQLFPLHQHGSSTNNIMPLDQNAWHQTNPITWAVSDTMHFSLKLPIVGWSANTQMSEDFSGRDVVFIAEDSSGYSILHADQTIVDWGTVLTDTTNSYEADTTGYYTIPETGYYDVSASVSFTNTTELGEGEKIYIRLLGTGGAEVASGGTYELQSSPSGASYYNTDFHKLLHLDKGYQLAIGVYQNSSATLLLEATAQANYVSIAKRNSAQTILENETVACRVLNNDAPQVISSTAVTITNFNAAGFDTHNGFDFSTNKYTIPVTGYYQINGKIRASGVGASYIHFRINTSEVTSGGYDSSLVVKFFQADAYEHGVLSDIFHLNKGATVWLETDTASDTSYTIVNGSGYTSLSIAKIK